MFIAGDDALNAANMYAYCNGNPVMYSDPSGMAVSDLKVALGRRRRGPVLRGGAPGEFVLYRVELLTRDNGLVVVFDQVHR